jgi:hypothetical protein
VTQMSDFTKRLEEIQALTLNSAPLSLAESDRDNVRCLLRLALEFHDYLEKGSVEIASRILHGPLAKYVEDAQSASVNPSNKYDLEYVCESIRSGVESFYQLSASCKLLGDFPRGSFEWRSISSEESLKMRFVFLFGDFVKESGFEYKCRLLLDMFRLQMVFAAVACE